MITIKLPININLPDHLLRDFNSCVRYCYNRIIKDSLSEKQIRQLLNENQFFTNLDSWFIQCAMKEAYSWSNKSSNIIFGGKANFIKRCQNKITKEEWKEKRLHPLVIFGQAPANGNRKFNLDIIQNNQLVFKINRNTHIPIQLPKLRKNIARKLYLLESLANEKAMPYMIRLNNNQIWITFDESKIEQSKLNLLENRCIGIDLNPNYIGVSVLEFKELNYRVINKQCFDLSKLTVKSGRNSSHKDSKYIHNKLQYETTEIAKKIEKTSKSFNCKFIFMEDLTIKSKDNKIGRNFNRLVNNKWLRNLLTINLNKRAKHNGMKLFKVNPAYSSYIGNLQHDSFDPVNASIEVARRGYEVIILKNKKFYPDFNLKESIQSLWKEERIDLVDNWKELFKQIKNSGLKYRVPLNSTEFIGFRLLSRKSKVDIYNFI